MNNFKMKITRCMASLDYNIYFYHQEADGTKYFANPVRLVIDRRKPCGPGTVIEPTIRVPCDEFDFAIENEVKTASDQLLKQKDLDKKDHIESLEEIIYRLIDKGHAGR